MVMHRAEIASINALEILDSRGSPTLQVTVALQNGVSATASVPSGASTGEHEAHELRDQNDARFGGRGVLRAAANVRDVIAPALHGRDVRDQAAIDGAMIELDGTPNKHRLGANAILGVSMAVARAAAIASGLPLYRHLNGADAARLPMPMMNIINGGKHAENGVAFQEFMIVPVGASSFAEAMRYGVETYAALRTLLKNKDLSTGSSATKAVSRPALSGNEEACALIVGRDKGGGLRAGASTSRSRSIRRHQASIPAAPIVSDRTPKSAVSSEVLADLYRDWVERFPIVSIEDGFDENDWSAFARQTATIGKLRPGRRRRPLRDQPPLHRARHRGALHQRGADQAQSDRHGHRNSRRD